MTCLCQLSSDTLAETRPLKKGIITINLVTLLSFMLINLYSKPYVYT